MAGDKKQAAQSPFSTAALKMATFYICMPIFIFPMTSANYYLFFQ
jgi:hypothetical protein